MNYLRGLGGGTGARPIVQLTDDYSVLDGASVHSDNNLLAGTPRDRYEGGRFLQGAGEQGQHQRGGGTPNTQGGLGQGGIPAEINDGAHDDIRSQITGPNVPGGGGRGREQGPEGTGGGSTSPSPTKINKGGPPRLGGAQRLPRRPGAASRHGSRGSLNATTMPSSSASLNGKGKSRGTTNELMLFATRRSIKWRFELSRS